MGADKYKVIHQQCEDNLRSGQVGKASQLLTGLNLAKVPREWRLPLAKICRRAGSNSTGLKLLTPLILSPQRKLSAVPTAHEITEYAVLLQRNGSVDEALRLLDKVDEAAVPEANLYRAFCYFNRWDYAKAVSKLESYIGATSPGYARLTGQVNLCAAFAMTKRHGEALALLDQVFASARAGGHRRLEANAHEISAQVRIQMGDYKEAALSLEKGATLLDSLKVHDSIFIQKWKAYLGALDAGSLIPLEDLKAQAMRGNFFETAREADLFALKIQFDQGRFENLLFGTPFYEYRMRAQDELGIRHLASHAVHGDPRGPIFDLEIGVYAGREIVKSGGKIHQTIAILLRDLYKPAKMGTLFTDLFPGEYFDIFSSPDRIHQILKRTRQWIIQEDLPLVIEQVKSSYRLRMTGPIAFRLGYERSASDWFAIQARKAEKILSQNQEISGGELRRALEMTEAEYKRYLKWALEQGKIRRVGGGRSTSYKAA